MGNMKVEIWFDVQQNGRGGKCRQIRSLMAQWESMRKSFGRITWEGFGVSELINYKYKQKLPGRSPRNMTLSISWEIVVQSKISFVFYKHDFLIAGRNKDFWWFFSILLSPVMNAASAATGRFVMPKQASFVWQTWQPVPPRRKTWHQQEVYYYALKAFTEHWHLLLLVFFSSFWNFLVHFCIVRYFLGTSKKYTIMPWKLSLSIDFFCTFGYFLVILRHPQDIYTIMHGAFALVINIFSYASSSTLYSCQWVGESVIVSD